MLVTSIFSFSHDGFERFLFQGRYNLGLCGRELKSPYGICTHSIAEPQPVQPVSSVRQKEKKTKKETSKSCVGSRMDCKIVQPSLIKRCSHQHVFLLYAHMGDISPHPPAPEGCYFLWHLSKTMPL